MCSKINRMVEQDMNDDLEFSIATMPASRPADYYLSYWGGSVFMDFDNCQKGCICLKRISFDRYGCCNLKGHIVPMDDVDSLAFKVIMKERLSDQSHLRIIVRRTILTNKKLIWEDALNEYNLL